MISTIDEVNHRKRAFAIIAGTEIFERLGYCGTQILLVLFVAGSAVPGDIVGLTTLAGLLGSPDDPAALSTRLFGAFAAATYLAPLFGAIVAARFGRRLTIAVGCLLMTMGHLTMATERWLLAGLVLLVLGAGCTIANKLALLGDLYDDGDPARVRAFGLYTVATNIGVVLAPLICGTLGEQYGLRWGFGAAGVGMGIGTIVFLAGWPSLPIHGQGRVAEFAPRPRPKIIVAALLVPFLIVTAVLNLAYSLVPIWASEAVDRMVLGWTMPVSWLISFDGIVSIIAIGSTTILWRWLAARRREPRDIVKLAIGCLLVALAFTILTLVSSWTRTPLIGVLVFYVVLDCSQGWIEPPLASLIARLSPPGRSGVPMAMMKAATALAAVTLGAMSGFYKPMGATLFWGAAAAVAAMAAMMVVAIAASIRRQHRL